MMIVSHRHKFVFVKTRKTGGTSVEMALSDHCGPRDIVTPIAAEDEAARAERAGGPQNAAVPLRGMLAQPRTLITLAKRRRRPQLYDHYPAGLIRRAIGPRRWAEYRTFTIERDPWAKAVSLYYWRTRDIKPRPPFSDFIRSVGQSSLSNYHLYSGTDGVLVDKVVRYENLVDGLAQWWAETGLPGTPSLPNAKGGHRPKGNWRDMYGPGDVEFVADSCRREIEMFGYTFDES